MKYKTTKLNINKINYYQLQFLTALGWISEPFLISGEEPILVETPGDRYSNPTIIDKRYKSFMILNIK